MKPCAHRINDHRTCVKCGQVIGLELSNGRVGRGSIRTADEITTAEQSSGVSLRYPHNRLGTDDRILLTIKDRARTGGEIREALHRGARWRGKHRWRERGLRQALIKIDKLTEKLSLPNTVQEEIAYLYRKCQRENLNLGHSTSITVGALVYAVGRMRCISRTTGEVCEAIGDDREKLLRKEVRRLTKALNLELPIKGTTELAKEYLPRFATKLGLGNEAVRKGLAILDNNGHTNQHPAVLAGAVLYVVAKPPDKSPPSSENFSNKFQERLRLYHQGLNDCEIAKRLGINPKSICGWRLKRGLVKNVSKDKDRLRLYQLRLSDGEIAKRCGVCKVAICNWRRGRGLKANLKSGGQSPSFLRRLRLYQLGLSDGAIAKRCGVRKISIRKWRGRRGLTANFKAGGEYRRKRELPPKPKGIPLNVIVERLGVGVGGLSRTARSLEFSTL